MILKHLGLNYTYLCPLQQLLQCRLDKTVRWLYMCIHRRLLWRWTWISQEYHPPWSSTWLSREQVRMGTRLSSMKCPRLSQVLGSNNVIRRYHMTMPQESQCWILHEKRQNGMFYHKGFTGFSTQYKKYCQNEDNSILIKDFFW